MQYDESYDTNIVDIRRLTLTFDITSLQQLPGIFSDLHQQVTELYHGVPKFKGDACAWEPIFSPHLLIKA